MREARRFVGRLANDEVALSLEVLLDEAAHAVGRLIRDQTEVDRGHRLGADDVRGRVTDGAAGDAAYVESRKHQLRLQRRRLRLGASESEVAFDLRVVVR